MPDENASNSFAAIIVAAGKGQRAGGDIPKQFRNWRGKPLIRHSVDAFLEADCETIVLVIPEGMENEAIAAAGPDPRIQTASGGATRQLSVQAGLRLLQDGAIGSVLIHDAARPDLPKEVIDRLLNALTTSEGAIPVLPVVDSLAFDEAGSMGESADRNRLRRVQTPQGFRYQEILAAHNAWKGEPDAGDDAQVLAAYGKSVKLVDGDERLKKMTFEADFGSTTASIRIGQGFDVHRLVEGEELWLCGVKIDHTKGLSGHSDADVALHAVVDAMFGAIGAGDIGTHFPPSDPQWKGAPSPLFLSHALKLVREGGHVIGNLDLTLICEEPKIGPHREAMQTRLAELLETDLRNVSVKATTTEKLGFTGRGEGIAAQAIITLQSN